MPVGAEDNFGPGYRLMLCKLNREEENYEEDQKTLLVGRVQGICH